MRRHAKLVGLGTALPAIAVAAHGCKEPTQVTVDVKTNVACADMRGVDVVAASDPRRAEDRAALLTTGPRFPSGSTTDCKEGAAPREVGTLVVTPDGDKGAVVVIAAFGKTRVGDCVAPQLPPSCIIARRRFSFIENRRITVPIVLDPECAGVPCNESSTCVGKKCVDSAIDCSGPECTEPGVASDGGIIEVDAFSPLVDGSPPDDDGSLPTDGSVAEDGAADGSADGGQDASGDGGTSACPGVTQCLPADGATAVVCAAPSKCCYSVGGGSCVAPGTKNPCAGLTACCHGQSACPAGTVCCADTLAVEPTTVIACRPEAECGGPRICSPVDMTCRQGSACDPGVVYSDDPSYFHCS